MKKVFLSFAGEDSQKAGKLIPLLRSPDYELDFYEGSLDLDFEAEGSEAQHFKGGRTRSNDDSGAELEHWNRSRSELGSGICTRG